MKKFFDLQWFADAGTLVNATGNYVNAYTGDTTSFTPGSTDLSPTMKTFYDTNLLDNARDKLIYVQLAKKEALPANRGKTVEWRKWNKLPDLSTLTEGVIPTGEKLGMIAITVSLSQLGEYVTISDVLDLHGMDDAIVGATEELGAAAGRSYDLIARTALMTGTNILFADAYNGSSYVSTPANEAGLQSALASYKCNLTPDMVAKAVTQLKKMLAPTFQGGKYVAVIHPSVAYDLRRSSEWIEAHKYAAVTEIFNGEIGELHGVRFIESTMAPVIKGALQTYATYKTMFFGKDAFAVVDPEGGGLQTIIHDRRAAGGPLEQFSTVGVKGETAAKILYQERLLTVWSGSYYSSTDSAA